MKVYGFEALKGFRASEFRVVACWGVRVSECCSGLGCFALLCGCFLKDHCSGLVVRAVGRPVSCKQPLSSLLLCGVLSDMPPVCREVIANHAYFMTSGTLADAWEENS